MFIIPIILPPQHTHLLNVAKLGLGRCCTSFRIQTNFCLQNNCVWNFKQVNGSLLPASVISVYCAYVCYTGLSSEPRDYVCNGLHNKSRVVSTGTLILGMLTTVLSVIYSALRAGSSTTFLSPPSSPKSGTEIDTD